MSTMGTEIFPAIGKTGATLEKVRIKTSKRVKIERINKGIKIRCIQIIPARKRYMTTNIPKTAMPDPIDTANFNLSELSMPGSGN